MCICSQLHVDLPPPPIVANKTQIKSIALGFDARATSPSLADAVAKGICDAGADVLDIGLAGTEEVYASVSAFDACAGVEKVE